MARSGVSMATDDGMALIRMKRKYRDIEEGDDVLPPEEGDCSIYLVVMK